MHLQISAKLIIRPGQKIGRVSRLNNACVIEKLRLDGSFYRVDCPRIKTRAPEILRAPSKRAFRFLRISMRQVEILEQLITVDCQGDTSLEIIDGEGIKLKFIKTIEFDRHENKSIIET